MKRQQRGPQDATRKGSSASAGQQRVELAFIPEREHLAEAALDRAPTSRVRLVALEGGRAVPDFTIRGPGPRTAQHVLFATGTEMAAPSHVAQRVRAVQSGLAATATLLVLLTRTEETAASFSDCQCELIAAGVVGGVPCGKEAAVRGRGGGAVASIVSVVNDEDVVAWLAALIGGDEDGRKKVGKAAAEDKSWDDRAVSCLEKAVSGLGHTTARKLLRDCGNLRAVRAMLESWWYRAWRVYLLFALVMLASHLVLSYDLGVKVEASRFAGKRVLCKTGCGSSGVHGCSLVTASPVLCDV